MKVYWLLGKTNSCTNSAADLYNDEEEENFSKSTAYNTTS
jgi:hypothetical protein